jgi:hypothetical protein
VLAPNKSAFEDVIEDEVGQLVAGGLEYPVADPFKGQGTVAALDVLSGGPGGRVGQEGVHRPQNCGSWRVLDVQLSRLGVGKVTRDRANRYISTGHLMGLVNCSVRTGILSVRGLR